jgi:hypothetical protein
MRVSNTERLGRRPEVIRADSIIRCAESVIQVATESSVQKNSRDVASPPRSWAAWAGWDGRWPAEAGGWKMQEKKVKREEEPSSWARVSGGLKIMAAPPPKSQLFFRTHPGKFEKNRRKW